MNKKVINTIIALTVVVILVIAFFLIKYTGREILPSFFSQPDNKVSSTNDLAILVDKMLNKTAPLFDLPDINGLKLKLSQYTNKPLVLTFWSTWSSDASNQIRIIDDYIYTDGSAKNLISFVAISSQEEIGVVKSFIKRGGYVVPIAIDSSGIVSEEYNIKSLPTTFFIDKNGIIKEVYVGILNEEMLVDKVDNILK